MRMVEGNIVEGEAKKQALENSLTDGYTLMNKVHDYPKNLALKNHLVYPMREKIQGLFSNTKDFTDPTQLQQINDQIDAIQAQVDHIEEEFAKMKKVIKDMQPPMWIQVLTLKEVCDSSGQ